MTPPVAAFYTPLKHPFQAEPSGDRTLGRLLLDGLRACGFAPEMASRLATWRRHFEAEAAARIERCAAMCAQGLVRRYRRRPASGRPRLWMTYQNYYRCPDLLGPVLATALEVPYVLVNAAVSDASRRTPFRPWVSAVRLAVRRADLIFATSPRDVPRLARLRGAGFARERLLLLEPPVDLSRFAADAPTRAVHRHALARGFADADAPLCLCVAMMREADKLDSYRLLGDALARLSRGPAAPPWRLLVVGDGPARPAVEAALAPLPAGRVRYAGALPPDALPPVYLGADLFAFPGLGEEFGLVYLEAAAAGLPAVACRGPGPEATVPPGGILTQPDPEAFAEGLRPLLQDPAERRRRGEAAQAFVARERSVEAFRRRLAAGLARLGLP